MPTAIPVVWWWVRGHNLHMVLMDSVFKDLSNMIFHGNLVVIDRMHITLPWLDNLFCISNSRPYYSVWLDILLDNKNAVKIRFFDLNAQEEEDGWEGIPFYSGWRDLLCSNGYLKASDFQIFPRSRHLNSKCLKCTIPSWRELRGQMIMCYK